MFFFQKKLRNPISRPPLTTKNTSHPKSHTWILVPIEPHHMLPTHASTLLYDASACCMMPPHANNMCCTSSLHIIRYKPRLSPYLAQYTLMGARYHPMRPWCQIVQVKVLTIIQGIIIVSNNSIILPININIRPFFFFISQLQRYFFLSMSRRVELRAVKGLEWLGGGFGGQSPSCVEGL